MSKVIYGRWTRGRKSNFSSVPVSTCLKYLLSDFLAVVRKEM